MQISDLVAIGTLGNSIDEKGFLSFHDQGKIDFEKLNNVFLIFTDHRVRYVSIIDKAQKKEKKLRIDDKEIAMETVKMGGAEIALPYWELPQTDQEKLVGKSIFFQKKKLGNVINLIKSNKQTTLIISNEKDQEIMIPYVEYYIDTVTDDVIIIKNAESLLEIYQ